MTVLAAVLALTVTASGWAVPPGAEYVAMGSSFAAGPGIPPSQPSSPTACGRSSKNYPSLAAAKLRLALTDVSCSGATTANLLTAPQHGQPPQVDAVTANTRLVSITIGGNDVNYVGSLFAYSCQTSGGGAQCPSVDQAAIDAALKTVHTKIGNVVTAVRNKAPRAKVLLVNYLTILPRTGPACTGVPLTQAQVDFERGVARRLADATRRAAAETGASVVDAASASAKHDACASTPWMEKYNPGQGRAGYHPTPTGMAAVADLVIDQIS
ncbi:SGNH/GDSL hydrolase family protein [Allokutzneria sp. A3M-2-11 16]|uniref:SGNH/GDSL hydrolase family protein n=1 Tax=Allokutzneria sp. A3M-2-11 16 TaxID=2962043 RepID=UPI0020B66C0A|nr:SGNH/GDSL hydrolase family protein [Allokutzneria sp. A3M-2-11 16]MCP3802061.1 SGNH/GDSL hydrolase family protein [Allokutzneria sp. A3M-2-11 16]